MSEFAGQKVALAGGSGFVGVHVAAELIAAGHRVVLLDRGTRALPDSLKGVERRACDLASGPIDPELLAGCDVLVNLVGIKRSDRRQSFEAVHVELVRSLRDAAQQAGVRRLIHMSVAGSRRDPASAYLDSKARGEALLREPVAGLEITIVRPGVIHGSGDDLLRNLADSIRAAPWFPAPRAGARFAAIQPIAVADVALAIRRCVERPATAGREYDLVGPESLALPELLARVVEVVGRPCRALAIPVGLLRPAVRVIERFGRDPLITLSQLGLLAGGVVGDREPARRDLELEPGPLDRAAIVAGLVGFRPRLPSVRLVPDRAAMRELEALAGAPTPARLGLFAALAVAGLLAGPWLIPGSPWFRMTGLELVLSLIALVGVPLAWARAWAASASKLAIGVGLGVALWLASLAVTSVIAATLPELWAGAGDLYGWGLELEPLHALPLLLIVVAGEEVVWRGALGLGLAARALERERVALAVLASGGLFTLAHLTTGNGLLWLAAGLAGIVWTAIAIRTRSLFVSFVCHLLWDGALLWLTPLA
ncbi:NAD(P)H-binding protein [Nannocystaceae bacterium ST9]